MLDQAWSQEESPTAYSVQHAYCTWFGRLGLATPAIGHKINCTRALNMCSTRVPRVGGIFCDSAWERENICHQRVATSVIVVPRSPYNNHINSSKLWCTSFCNSQMELSCVKACKTLGPAFINCLNQVTLPFPKKTQSAEHVNAWNPGRTEATSWPRLLTCYTLASTTRSYVSVMCVTVCRVIFPAANARIKTSISGLIICTSFSRFAAPRAWSMRIVSASSCVLQDD